MHEGHDYITNKMTTVHQHFTITMENYYNYFYNHSSNVSSIEITNNSSTSGGHYSHYSVCNLDFYTNQSSEVQISQIITTNLSMIVIFTGLVLNTIGMLVFCSKAMKKSSTAVYLFCLALSDNVYLLIVFLTRTLEGLKCLYFQNIKMDIHNQNIVVCKVSQYVLDTAADFSTLMILIVTVERFFACYYAILYKKYCSSRLAKIISGCLAFIIVLLISYHHISLVTIVTDHEKYSKICSYSPTGEKWFDVLYMTEFTVFRILPTFAIAILNVLVILNLWKRSKRKKAAKYHLVAARSNIDESVTVNSRTSAPKHNDDHHSSISVTLLLISTFYVMCYLPIILCYILVKLTKKEYVDISHSTLHIFRAYSRLLYIFGYAMNFIIFVLSGRLFRAELKKLCCKMSCK